MATTHIDRDHNDVVASFLPVLGRFICLVLWLILLSHDQKPQLLPTKAFFNNVIQKSNSNGVFFCF